MTLQFTLGVPAPTSSSLGGLSPDTSITPAVLLLRAVHTCSHTGHSDGTGPLPGHPPRDILRPPREGTSVTLGPGQRGEGSASVHPAWLPARLGPSPHVRCRPQPGPHTCVPGAGRTSRFRSEGPWEPSHVAQGPSPSLGGGSSHVSPLMWCDGIFQASFQKEKVNNVKALLPLLPRPDMPFGSGAG